MKMIRSNKTGYYITMHLAVLFTNSIYVQALSVTGSRLSVDILCAKQESFLCVQSRQQLANLLALVKATSSLGPKAHN
jgi:hypothetical protein